MLRSLSIFALVVLAPVSGSKHSASPMPPEPKLCGVDVSHHQKEIEWEAVAASEPIDFAFVKATEGRDFVDSLFCYNWEELRRLGIRRGAYHFFRAYGCGDEQAAHFLQQVEMHPGDLAPVLDIELLDDIAPEIMRQEALIWLQTVEKALGIKPIVYSNQNFYERHLAGHFDNYPLWIARYSQEKPVLMRGKKWDIWQFSNEGCVEGISKKVDLNIFPGTAEMLEKLCWYPNVPSPTESVLSLP